MKNSPIIGYNKANYLRIKSLIQQKYFLLFKLNDEMIRIVFTISKICPKSICKSEKSVKNYKNDCYILIME